MEDILASIRETVEEEVEKGDKVSEDLSQDIDAELLAEDVLSTSDETTETPTETVEEPSEEPSVDDILADMGESVEAVAETAETTDAPAVEEMNSEPAENASAEEAASESAISEDDILDLTDRIDDEPHVQEPAEASAPESDLIDVEKFAQSGEISEAQSQDVQASRDSYSENDDDIDVDLDSIMSELEADGELPNEDDAASFIAQNNTEDETNADAEADANENDNGDILKEEVDDIEMMADDIQEPMVEETTVEASAAVAEDVPVTAPVSAPAPSMTEAVTQAAAEEVAKKVFLPTSPSPKGLQVSFPAEVLAEALRPLVTDWINQNLADIVERLVKEEISKLVDR